MNTPIEAQIIRNVNGEPEYAVIPYHVYQELAGGKDYANNIPHEVVSRMIDGATAAQAWREHLGLTQAELARRAGISQSAYSQLETSTKLRPSSRRKIAEALGISPEQVVTNGV